MPTQSIDLTNVADATFNGSTVEQINLNGSGIWTKPVVSLWNMYWDESRGNPEVGGPDGVGLYNLSRSVADTPHPMSNRFYSPDSNGAIADRDGVVYIGPAREMDQGTGSIGEGNELIHAQFVPTTVPFYVAPNANHFYHYGVYQIAPTTYHHPEITPFATVSLADGIQPIDGGVTSGSVSWPCTVCVVVGAYGVCDQYADTTCYGSFSITPTLLSIDGLPFWRLDPTTGRMYYKNADSWCSVD